MIMKMDTLYFSGEKNIIAKILSQVKHFCQFVMILNKHTNIWIKTFCRKINLPFMRILYLKSLFKIVFDQICFYLSTDFQTLCCLFFDKLKSPIVVRNITVATMRKTTRMSSTMSSRFAH